MPLLFYAVTSIGFLPLLYAITDDLVLIGAGSYYMGQEGIQDDEEPLHYVKVKPFEVDRFEIKIVDWFFYCQLGCEKWVHF